MNALVPAKTFAVCNNGLSKGIMVVTSQEVVKTQDGRLIATEKDKPTNFKCVYMGILLAVLAVAICAFFPAIGALATILIATIVGIIGSFSLGAFLCYFCLKSSVWLPGSTHPNITIENKPALIGSAKIICKPLGFLPQGNVTLIYDESVANRISSIYAINNCMKIMGWASVGVGFSSLCKVAKGVFTFSGGGLKGVLAATGVDAVLVGAGLYIGSKINKLEDRTSTFLAKNIFGVASKKGDDESSVADDIATALSNAPADENVIPPYPKTEYYKTQLNIGAGGTAMTRMWELVKADPSWYPGMPKPELEALKSKYLAQAKAELSQQINKIANKLAKKDAYKNAIKDAAITIAVTSGLNIAGKTAVKVLQAGVDGNTNKEIAAMMKNGIFEQSI